MDLQQIETIAQKAIEVAEKWQNRANELLTQEEKGIQEQMRSLLSHPADKLALMRIIDQSFRSSNAARVADQVSNLLRECGVPDFFSRFEKILVQMFLGFGRHFPALAVPRLIEKMRDSSSRAIIAGEPRILHAHLQKRKRQGVRMNINHLGESLLGESQALRRLETYIADLQNPAIEYISVKISTIYSQIQSLAFDHTIGILKERLSQLYRVAQDNTYILNNGTAVTKFVNLDMEEYRDLEITYKAFRETLDQAEFKHHSAGIVLQAYLPDSFAVQKELTAWARKRLSAGGSPIRIRIVKGANMEMEQVEAALCGWPLAPYDNKLDVDANYKRMLNFGMLPDNIRAVHLGIASHNLFELAYAYELAKANQVTDYFYFEMLEGMADHVRRALGEVDGDVLLYAPVATKEQFISAIAYLIRRLDENTAPENFLRYAPFLQTNSEEWRFLADQFTSACLHIEHAGTKPNRIQDRSSESFTKEMGTYFTGEFQNEPPTDWSLAANRRWAESIRAKWKKKPGDAPIQIPLIIGAEEIFQDRECKDCFDPSQYNDRVCVARFRLAVANDIEKAVATAKADPDGWRQMSPSERFATLSKVAMALRQMRADLIGAAAANTGKIFTEADMEVCQAIDFAEYYPFSVKTFTQMENVVVQGKGVGVVISPSSFPIAIPCGGIIAALASGNTVIFKPSTEAVLAAWHLCQAFYDAGISKNTLQFCPGAGATTGVQLAEHGDVDFVILSGGTDTGMKILARRPDVLLTAATGGKNATIVTAMADRGQAMQNVIYSAFGNSGQKCSAASLLILEEEIYRDEHFKEQLVDATRSVAVGSAWDFENKMGPLIRPPSGELERALVKLKPGESWALKPKKINGHPHMWTPGIKWDVQPGSTTHQIEFFGPLLGVMPAKNLDHAIALANQTEYGLTAALESLDPREQEQWKAEMLAGNLYINHGTTGATTLRQPFGGMKKSVLGPAIKTGSPNYVSQFMRFKETGYPPSDALEQDHALLTLAQQWQRKLDWGAWPELKKDLLKTIRAIKSYLYNYEHLFSRAKDYFHLRGQDNVLRFLPLGKVVVRVQAADSLFETLARVAAARICGNATIVSVSEGLLNDVNAFLAATEGRALIGDAELVRQTDKELIALIPEVQRIRYAAAERVPTEVFQAAAQTGFFIARAPVLMEGRIELLHYLLNQSVGDTYHRYGNLGERGLL